MKLLSILSFFLFFLFYTLCQAQTIKRMDDLTWNNINDVVSNTYNAYDLKGISVAVVYGGNVAYANAFGDKNEDGDPFTIETKSLLASVSKLITGVMAMRLVENGEWALDDDIGDYVPAYNNSGITIRHLLSHMSGMSHYSDCPSGYNGDFDPFASMLTVAGCSMCFSPPGGDRIYTTYGTTLLGIGIDIVGEDQYNLNYKELYDTWLHDPGGLGTLEPQYHNLDPLLAEGSNGPGYWSDLGF